MKTTYQFPDDVHYNVFDQIKYLVLQKGMTTADALEEIESKLSGRLPEYIRNKIREESVKW